MKNKKLIDNQILYWADIVKQQTKVLKEDVNEEDIISNCFGTLLRFMNGEGDKVLKDTEWMLYLINDLHAASRKGLWKPDADDEQILSRLSKLSSKD